METKAEFGLRGEESAASFLCGKGYKIVARNARLGHSEIDIIAKDDQRVIFVEVKTRQNDDFGVPADAVGYNKRKKIIETAEKYIYENNLP